MRGPERNLKHNARPVVPIAPPLIASKAGVTSQFDQKVFMRLFAGTEWDNPVHCETCGELVSNCTCPPPPPEPIAPNKQLLRIGAEKRKRGKIVTVIRDLAETNDHSELLTRLKNHCGAGGTIKENTIEIQGDHTTRAKAFLLEAGYRVKN